MKITDIVSEDIESELNTLKADLAKAKGHREKKPMKPRPEMKPKQYNEPTEPVVYGPSQEESNRVYTLIKNHSKDIKKTMVAQSSSTRQYKLVVPNDLRLKEDDLVHLAYGKYATFGGNAKATAHGAHSTIYHVTVHTD